MEQYAWLLWIVLGVILIIAEIFTLGFVLFWFGIAAFAAAFAGFFGLDLVGQFLVFAVTSIVLTIFSRTLFANYLPGGSEEEKVKTGINSLPGQIGTVVGASKGALQTGEVKVFGSTWTAFTEEGEPPLIEGEKVEVLYVKGASIYVRRIGELPEWREKDT